MNMRRAHLCRTAERVSFASSLTRLIEVPGRISWNSQNKSSFQRASTRTEISLPDMWPTELMLEMLCRCGDLEGAPRMVVEGPGDYFSRAQEQPVEAPPYRRATMLHYFS